MQLNKDTQEKQLEKAIAIGHSVRADGRMGHPTEDEHKEIIRLTGLDSEPEDWFVFDVYMSDNLVDRDYQRWHPNVLVQMGTQYHGRQLSIDHEFSSKMVQGFTMNPVLRVDPSPSVELLNAGGFLEWNQKVCSRENHQSLRVLGVVKAGSEAHQKIIERRYNKVSTGTMLSGIRRICPNCSEEKGREVDFMERDKHDDYVCPHLIPNQFARWMADMGLLEDNEKLADYVTLDGVNTSLELSFVLEGALPAARIMRENSTII